MSRAALALRLLVALQLQLLGVASASSIKKAPADEGDENNPSKVGAGFLFG